MPRFTRAELEAFRDTEVPDLIGPGLRLLIVGINPGLMTAALGIPFANPGNRFRPALVEAGIMPPPPAGAGRGMTLPDLDTLIERGIGITSLVARATARAAELSDAELVEGRSHLEALVAERRPRVVAVLGITAYRVAFARPRAVPGRQPDDLAGAQLWVVPNPSGLNAHESVQSLATAYAEPAVAAGVLPVGAP